MRPLSPWQALETGLGLPAYTLAMLVTRILAIRHGETDWNVDHRIQGQLDIALNDTGVWQANQAAHALRHESIQAIYSSDLQRASTTAQRLANTLELTVTLEPGLRERHFGMLQGLTWAEIESEWPQEARLWRSRVPDWSPPNGGESLEKVRARVAETVGRLAQQHVGEHIVLVTHGGVLDCLYRMATGQDTHAPRTWQLGNTALNRLLWTEQGLSLVGWGDASHLEKS